MPSAPSRDQQGATRKAAGSIREFLVSVELWSPAKSSGYVRKQPIPRKGSDRRDSLGTSAPAPFEEKKIKEKSSWFRGYGGFSSVAGHWRSAICKLSEEGDRHILNIYVDETILQHSIYVHMLRHTDIRVADRSLFFRNDCLGIHTTAGQRWKDSNPEDVIYIQFPNSDANNTWLALLRSYANPETYGRRLAPADGGLYRMWRQVDLGVVQGRNLGIAKSLNTAQPGAIGDFDTPDAIDMDVFCEIYVNGVLCGRTTVKKGIGAPDWHEHFTFCDLPPFGELLVYLYREKRVLKPLLLGSIRITLSTFRRGELVDQWFPVLSAGPTGCDQQVGEIRLKMKVDEEIILPNTAYSSIIQAISQRNTLDLLHELEQEMKLVHISSDIIAIAVAKDVLARDILALAVREVEHSPSSQNTLFRGNTVFTKTMELAMAWYGKAFLEASVGSVIRRLCAEKVSIEVDPVRSGKGIKDLEKNVDLLAHWCSVFWNQIYAVRGDCPHELRKLFHHIRVLVEKRYEQTENRDIKWQSVSAFCFLRFIVPAILHPHLFGLCPGLPPPPVQRSLILIAKVMQSLANLNPTVQKEEFMRGIKNFTRHSLPAMIDYIVVVSTPVPEQRSPYTSTLSDKQNRLHAINSLRERTPSMSALHREAIPLLPHLLDVPKHLAILASAVVRNRKSPRANFPRARGSPLTEFTMKCFEVEEQALQCVSRLARRSKHPLNERSLSEFRAIRDGEASSSFVQSVHPPSPRTRAYEQNLETGPSSHRNRRESRGARPSTAPSSQHPDTPAAPEEMISTTAHRGSSGKPVSGSVDTTSSDRRSTEGLSDWKGVALARVRTTPAQPTLAASSEPPDDARKRKGFLRGFLARR